MITHYIPIWTKMNKDRALAVCKRYVDYASDSDQPTCADCRRLIAEEEDAHECPRCGYRGSALSYCDRCMERGIIISLQ